jgi:protein-S-isoprenylcysteine O-methyltransferase Ste14
MNHPILVLFLLNLAFIGLLPRIFFKKGGRYNLRWWFTAAPFLLCAIFLLGSLCPVPWNPLILPPAWQDTLTVIAVPFSAVSISLIALTIGSHQRPLSLWHQKNDAPEHLVTHGPYRRIRHPFYAAFLLALSGAFLAYPSLGTLFTLAYGLLIMNVTAAGEEKRFLASEFGPRYEAYIKATGRFLPHLKGYTGND